MGCSMGDLHEERPRRSHSEVATSSGGLADRADGADGDGTAVAVEQPPCSQIIAKHTITALSMYQLHTDHVRDAATSCAHCIAAFPPSLGNRQRQDPATYLTRSRSNNNECDMTTSNHLSPGTSPRLLPPRHVLANLGCESARRAVSARQGTDHSYTPEPQGQLLRRAHQGCPGRVGCPGASTLDLDSRPCSNSCNPR